MLKCTNGVLKCANELKRLLSGNKHSLRYLFRISLNDDSSLFPDV